MPGKGFTSLNVRLDIAEKFNNLKRMEPNMTKQGFMEELLKFYEKYHCPECHESTAVKDKHHKC